VPLAGSLGRGEEELYEQTIRAHVETDANTGKLVSIDIETGDYETGDDTDLDAPRRLHAKHPGAAVYTRRIGYNTTYALGGVLERTAQDEGPGRDDRGPLDCDPEVSVIPI
jgi:hypothetical protein